VLPATQVPTAAVEQRFIDGNFGRIYHNGNYQADLREFSGRLSIERREIPRAGTNGTIYRRGRIAREGSFRLGYVDTRFTKLLIDYANKTPDEMRAARGQGIDIFPSFEFTIALDDPDSWGAEEIKLMGVRFWEIGLGFAQNEYLERDLPCTWDTEMVVKGIPRPGNLDGYDTPANQTTWGGAGFEGSPVI
jgi:hypothetical protein